MSDLTARRELAVLAAQLVADSGLDYAHAKRKAARDLFGNDRVPRSVLPDNDAIDAALREHLELFDGPEHARRVAHMRDTALQLMALLAEFNPYATGAVWKGIAAAHATLHLQLFSDSAKDVAIFLLNRGIEFDSSEATHFRGHGSVEALVFEYRGVPVLLSVYRRDDLRGAVRAGPDGADRGTRAQLAALTQSATNA